MRAALTAFSLLVTAAAPAAAATPEEDLVRAWLEGVSFGVPVEVETSAWDPAGRTVTLETVTIGRPGGSFVLTVDRLSVEAPRRTSDGRFAALAVRGSGIGGLLRFDPKAWFPELVAFEEKKRADEAAEIRPDGDDAQIDGPSTTDGPSFQRIDIHVDAESVLWERVELPLDSPTFAATASLTDRYIGTMRWMSGWRAEWAEAQALEVSTRGAPDGADSNVTYDRYYAAGMSDGRIERIGFVGSRQIESVDGTEVTVTIGGGEAIGIDSAAVLEVIDPARFVDGKPDGRWRTVVSSMIVQDFRAEAPDFTMTIADIQSSGVRVRQSGKPLLPLWEDVLRHPERMETDPIPFIGDLLPAAAGFYGLDRLAINDVSLSGQDGFTARMEAADIAQADSDGIGAMTFHGLSVDAGAAGSGRIDLFSLNDLRFGSLDSWLSMAGEMERTGVEDPSPQAVRRLFLEGLPALRFMELSGLSVETPDATVSLDSYTATGGDFLGQFARRTDVTLTGLSIPVSGIPDPSVREPLAAMGYERIAVSLALTTRWDDKAGRFHVEDVVATAEEMGLVSLEVTFGNLPTSMLDDPDRIEERMMEMTLESARLVFGNRSIVERVFEQQAKPLNQDPVQFRKNFGGGIPLMLGFLGDADLQKRLAPPLRAFFEDPKSLVLTLNPAAPVPMSAFQGIEATPGAMGRLLGLEMSANR